MSEKEFWVPPREANILITGKCNLKCRHCSVSSYGKPVDDLPLSTWTEILDQLVSYRLLKVTVSGGEPMARPDFPEFLTALASRPLRVSVNTNATMISKVALAALQKLGPRLETVMVSLDGSDDKIHDSQRGAGAFRALNNGVRLLRNGAIPFGFYCTVTSVNVNNLVGIAKLAEALGGSWIKFNSFLYAGPDLEHSMIPDVNLFREAVGQLESYSGNSNFAVLGTLLEMRSRVRKLEMGRLSPCIKGAYTCGGGTLKIAIFPDGTVTPCDHLPEYKLGNLLTYSLWAILHSSEMKTFTSFLSQPRENCPKCVNCDLLSLCPGGCPVEAILRGDNPGFDRHSCLKEALKGETL